MVALSTKMTAAPTAATGNNCRTCMGTSLRIVLVGLPDGPILSRPIGPCTSRAPRLAQDYSFDRTTALRLRAPSRVDRESSSAAVLAVRYARYAKLLRVPAGRFARGPPTRL